MASGNRRLARAVALCFVLAGCSDTARLTNQPVFDHADGLAIGHRLMAGGEYELALTAYTRAVSQYGLTPDVLSALGSANLKLGRLEQSRRYLERAVEIDEGYAAAWNNLGVVYANLGDPHEAEAAFRAAFSLEGGQSEEIWQNLVLAIEQTGRVDAPDQDTGRFRLVRRGGGRFLLLETPE